MTIIVVGPVRLYNNVKRTQAYGQNGSDTYPSMDQASLFFLILKIGLCFSYFKNRFKQIDLYELKSLQTYQCGYGPILFLKKNYFYDIIIINIFQYV